MTKKIPVGIQDFKELITEGYYYVDKTKPLYHLILQNKYYLLTRPRRFGKSIMLSLLKYLYLGEKELFVDTYLYDKRDRKNKQLPVVFLSLAGYTKDQDLTDYMQRNMQIYIDGNVYAITDLTEYFILSELLKVIFAKTGKKTAIIVDEYDKPVLQHLTDVPKAEKIRDMMSSFYGGVKDSDTMIELFMLTGLTKTLKMSVFSVLNNLQDLLYNPQGYDVLGYTQAEIEDHFDDELQTLQDKEQCTRNELLDKIKTYYNGYNFGDEQDSLYNPWNLNLLLLNQTFGFYRSDTGIPSAILHYIHKERIDVATLVEKVNTNTLYISEAKFKIENLATIQAEVLFTNAGYLTIKKNTRNVYTLGYPNQEAEVVMNEFFLTLVQPDLQYGGLLNYANSIYEGIVYQDEELLGEGLQGLIYDVLGDVAYDRVAKNPEGWFKTFLGLALRLNSINYYPEVQNLRGRKDLVIPVNDKYYIIEAKVNQSCKDAIAQIDKKYLPQLTDRPVVKIGLNWDRKEEKIEFLIQNQ